MMTEEERYFVEAIEAYCVGQSLRLTEIIRRLSAENADLGRELPAGVPGKEER